MVVHEYHRCMDAPHNGTGRILAVVVDWSPADARATAARLTRRCGPSLPAFSLAAAVSMVRRIRPRLVVAELDLPQTFVGVRLLRELREIRDAEPGEPMRIVVLTANRADGVAAQARAAGADEVIRKADPDVDARLDAACALGGATAAGPVDADLLARRSYPTGRTLTTT